MKNNLSFAFGLVSLFSLQTAFFTYFENSVLRREIRLLERSRDLANDQINELFYTVDTLRSEKDSTATRQFVAGVIEAIQNKEYLTSVWHDGYDRGTSVISYTSQKEEKGK